MARAGMVFGNFVIQPGDGTVQITLNTFHKGRPYALFTPRELPKLIELLTKAARDATPEDEDDGMDLI